VTEWLLDTGPLVAFFDRSDSAHDWSKEMWAQAPVPMMTCEAVMAEAAYLLHEHAGLGPEKLMVLFERGVISTPFRLEEHSAAVGLLMAKYSDQNMRVADACLVKMSELHRDCRVFTLDARDFRVYRRFDRQVIPLITRE
jgi:predicted nucleic acid-binding protein